MAQVKRTIQRLRQIKERQWEQRWGKDYVASTFADPIEAPGISSATIMRPGKLGGREFHTLSEPETFAGLLALFHPNCWEVHEQFALFPKGRAHPLYGHPLSNGAQFKSFAGTINVADRLGLLKSHPRIVLDPGDDSAPRKVAPFPFLGDLRLFMQDDQGVYCLNWTVKDKYDDFKHKGPGSKPRAIDDLTDPAAVARHALEEAYHSDAGIRTQKVSKDRIDFNLRCNLRELHLSEGIPSALTSSQQAGALEFIRGFVGNDIPTNLVARRLAKEFAIADLDAMTFIRQSVLRRELRIDLFRPFLASKPLRPEVDDVFVRYAEWFRR